MAFPSHVADRGQSQDTCCITHVSAIMFSYQQVLSVNKDPHRRSEQVALALVLMRIQGNL